jgi:hypothetical protein
VVLGLMEAIVGFKMLGIVAIVYLGWLRYYNKNFLKKIAIKSPMELCTVKKSLIDMQFHQKNPKGLSYRRAVLLKNSSRFRKGDGISNKK